MLAPVGTSILALVLGLGGIAAAALVARTFATDVEQALRESKQIYVATRRADGSRSATAPVWFLYDGEAVYFTTGPNSHKVRRIEKGSPVFVAVGSSDGPSFEGKAEVVRDPDVAARIAPLYNQKYWISWLGLFRPRPDRIRDGKTVIIKIVPAAP